MVPKLRVPAKTLRKNSNMKEVDYPLRVHASPSGQRKQLILVKLWRLSHVKSANSIVDHLSNKQVFSQSLRTVQDGLIFLWTMFSLCSLFFWQLVSQLQYISLALLKLP